MKANPHPLSAGAPFKRSLGIASADAPKGFPVALWKPSDLPQEKESTDWVLTAGGAAVVDTAARLMLMRPHGQVRKKGGGACSYFFFLRLWSLYLRFRAVVGRQWRRAWKDGVTRGTGMRGAGRCVLCAGPCAPPGRVPAPAQDLMLRVHLCGIEP